MPTETAADRQERARRNRNRGGCRTVHGRVAQRAPAYHTVGMAWACREGLVFPSTGLPLAQLRLWVAGTFAAGRTLTEFGFSVVDGLAVGTPMRSFAVGGTVPLPPLDESFGPAIGSLAGRLFPAHASEAYLELPALDAGGDAPTVDVAGVLGLPRSNVAFTAAKRAGLGWFNAALWRSGEDSDREAMIDALAALDSARAPESRELRRHFRGLIGHASALHTDDDIARAICNPDGPLVASGVSESMFLGLHEPLAHDTGTVHVDGWAIDLAALVGLDRTSRAPSRRPARQAASR